MASHLPKRSLTSQANEGEPQQRNNERKDSMQCFSPLGHPHKTAHSMPQPGRGKFLPQEAQRGLLGMVLSWLEKGACTPHRFSRRRDIPLLRSVQGQRQQHQLVLLLPRAQ